LRRTLPYRTADNRIDGVVITFVDITARKHAEQAVEAGQARLQAVIEQMPAALLIVKSPSGKLLFGNRRAARLFGQPYPLPFIGSDWSAAAGAFKGFHADGRPYEADEWPLARTLAAATIVSDEEIGFQESHLVRGTLAASAAPIRNSKGKAIAAVATFWDISERKRMEQAHKESEERFRLLIESASDYAIFMTDTQGRITTWNAGAERLLGWSEAEAIGRAATMLFTPDDRVLGVPEHEMQRVLTEGRAADERAQVRKDGTQFWASGTLTLVHDPNGEVRGFARIMRDDTKIRQAQDQLRKALQVSEEVRDAAESANRAKDDFISIVSHELRTPLNTIRLWSRLLSNVGLPEKDRGAGIAAIDRAAVTQEALINDLLDVSRIASGQLRLAPRETRLADVVQAAIDSVMPSADSRGVKLKVQINEGIGIVKADPDRLQQVVLNLLSNAVKFTPSGGHIQVTLARHTNEVEICVTDSGIGIRPEFLPHVFERFRQAEMGTARAHAGLGLGLAIASQLVELHTGTITAESAGEGLGATFRVRLPLPQHYGVAPVEELTEGAQVTEDLRGSDMLIVDDEGDAGEATRRLMQSAGATVRAVTSAAAAREAYAIRRPDVILCDIVRP